MDNFAQNWLAIQCSLIKDCCCAFLMMKEPDSNLIKPLAQWPVNSKEPLQLSTIAQLALKKGVDVINPNVFFPGLNGQAFDYYASPLFIGTRLIGVIAIKTTLQSESGQQQIFALLD